MGIYDREYYRGETGGSGWFGGVSPVCKALIAINVAVFLFEQLTKIDLRERFAATPDGVLHHVRVWQLLTATFLHDDIWHILGNMWFFWIVAREIESLYGSRDFLIFYLCAAVFSTLAWVLIDAARNGTGATVPMIGASGAVMATVTLFTLFYPRREILLFFIPMPMWVLLVIYLGFPFLNNLAGAETRVAVESHLAGAGFAFLFRQFDLRWSRLLTGRVFKPRLRIFSPVPREQTRTRTPNPSRSAATVGSAGKSAPASVIPEEQLDAKLDEVLAKIAREGRSGLTEEELRVLQEASRRARIRRSDRF
jgi:membrane associated rhomboid family serine protease